MTSRAPVSDVRAWIRPLKPGGVLKPRWQWFVRTPNVWGQGSAYTKAMAELAIRDHAASDGYLTVRIERLEPFGKWAI